METAAFYLTSQGSWPQITQIPFFRRNFTAATGGFNKAVFSSEGVELVIIEKGKAMDQSDLRSKSMVAALKRARRNETWL